MYVMMMVIVIMTVFQMLTKLIVITMELLMTVSLIKMEIMYLTIVTTVLGYIILIKMIVIMME